MATPSVQAKHTRTSSFRNLLSSKRRKHVAHSEHATRPILEESPSDEKSSDKPPQGPSVQSTDMSEHVVPDPPLADDAEQGSVTNTLTGTQTLTLPRSSRLEESRSTTSDGDASALSIVKSQSLPPRPLAPSLLSKFVSKFLTCMGPSSAHPLEIDDSISPNSDLESDISLRDMPKPADPQLVNPFRPPPLGGPLSTVTSPPATEIDIVILPPPTKQLLPQSETDGLTSGAVQPPGSTGDEIAHAHMRDSGDETDNTNSTDDYAIRGVALDEDEDDEEERLIRNGGAGIPIGPDGIPRPLLPPVAPHHLGRKCLVLDLDETLVHSSFRAVQQADFIVPVEIESHWHHFHVLKRPGVDSFLKSMGELFEVVVYTASLSKYADPVLDKLDIHQSVTHRLFRESCYNHKGNYIKDLSQLGRPIAETIILDNSPASYIFHPNNAVPVSSWFNDPHDTELVDLVPFLSDLTVVDDVRGILDGNR